MIFEFLRNKYFSFNQVASVENYKENRMHK
jgi:hypothetical protein